MVKEKDDGGVLHCRTCMNPYMFAIFGFLLFDSLQNILTKDWDGIGAVFFIIIGFIFINDSFNNIDAIYKEINRRLAARE